jgi:hypothetical protein
MKTKNKQKMEYKKETKGARRAIHGTALRNNFYIV